MYLEIFSFPDAAGPSTVIILFDATVEISKEIRKGQKIRVGQKIGLLK